MKAKKIVNRALLWIASVVAGALTYIGAVAVVAYFMDGDERSLFIAILPALAVTFGLVEQREEKERKKK
jgi:hypothetical protein